MISDKCPLCIEPIVGTNPISLKCLNDLVNDVISSGMDPNYEITHNGILTGEMASDFILELGHA